MTQEIDPSFSESQFAELAYEHAPIGLVVTNNRVIKSCNIAFANMFGYGVDELRDQLFDILYPTIEEFVNVRDRGVSQLRETNTYWDERIMARQNGDLFWCRVRGHTFTPDTPLEYAVWSFADLSHVRPYKSLTRREREIVSYLGEGLTSKEIAIRLDISHRTVEVYRAKLLKKFNLPNTGALFQSLGNIDAEQIVGRSAG